MHATFPLRALMASCASLAMGNIVAGTIHGSVSQNGEPVQQKQITLDCPGEALMTRSTDSRGSYRFTTNFNGSCTASVVGATSTSVLLTSSPTQYDFEIRSVQGQLKLLHH